MLKIVSARGNCAAVTLLEGAMALINIFLQAVVKILITTSLRDLRLIVELDLIHQQPGESLRLAMNVCIFGGKSSQRIGSCGRSRGGAGMRRRYFDNLGGRLRLYVLGRVRREGIGKRRNG